MTSFLENHKHFLQALAVLFVLCAIPARTQEKPPVAWTAWTCGFWIDSNKIAQLAGEDTERANENMQLAYVYGYMDGVLAYDNNLTDSTLQAHSQHLSQLWPTKLNVGEVQRRAETYCSDPTHRDQQVYTAIQQIADYFNK